MPNTLKGIYDFAFAHCTSLTEVTIPLGTKNKYEIDKESGKIRLSRVQYSSMTYPSEYGFIDETIAPDGDVIIYGL